MDKIRKNNPDEQCKEGRENINNYKDICLLFHNDKRVEINYIVGLSQKTAEVSDCFISRLKSAYILSANEYFKSLGTEVSGSDFSANWLSIGIKDRKNDIHTAVYINPNIQIMKELLSDPNNSNLWYGFHEPTKEHPINFQHLSSMLALWDFDVLYRFSEAVGACRCWYPEYPTPQNWPDPDDLVRGLEKELKVEFVFPAPYPHMIGVKTFRGIIGAREIWGIYAAYLCRKFEAKKVLEIGGGLGWAAYHAAQFGVKEYWIVDIPMTALASSHFLGLACGEESIRLYGEDNVVDTGKEQWPAIYTIVPPNAFPESKKFDLVLNMDSMTEMPKETALDYIAKIKRITHRFISINHEANPFTVRELLKDDADVKNYTRNAFWLRRGYVEEIFEF